MSTLKNRTYVLNVAQQFLQGTSENPLLNKGWLDEICGKSGRDSNCFYRNFINEAEHFLESFGQDKLQQILCAAPPPPQVSPVPMKTPLMYLNPGISDLLNRSEEQILQKLAALSLVAAAYDLCYAKHHQGGVRPV